MSERHPHGEGWGKRGTLGQKRTGKEAGRERRGERAKHCGVEWNRHFRCASSTSKILLAFLASVVVLVNAKGLFSFFTPLFSLLPLP